MIVRGISLTLINKWRNRPFFVGNMTIKYIKKLNISAVVIVLVFVLAPMVSYASFFNWLWNYGPNQTGYSNSLISQGSLIYSSSIFNQKDSNDYDRLASVFQGDSLMPLSSILSVGYSSEETVVSVKKTLSVRVTAYSSTPDQTDDSPFITASGTHVRDGIVATNMLPFKTLVRFPELFGDKVFVVEDRMNARYTNVVDIWFPDRQSALNLGNRTATMEVIGSL